MKRLVRTRKLFGFLRTHRGELFDDAFQAELESMYRDTGAGKDPVAPALLAMVVLLQGIPGGRAHREHRPRRAPPTPTPQADRDPEGSRTTP